MSNKRFSVNSQPLLLNDAHTLWVFLTRAIEIPECDTKSIGSTQVGLLVVKTSTKSKSTRRGCVEILRAAAGRRGERRASICGLELVLPAADSRKGLPHREGPASNAHIYFYIFCEKRKPVREIIFVVDI